MQNFGKVIRRTSDNSYVINDGMYHVPNNDEYAKLWQGVHAYALANPAMVTEERPYEPSLEELKTAKLAEVDQWTANKITGGFISNASGEAVTYDSDKDTQLTMQGIALNVNTALFAEKYPDGCPVRGYAAGADVKDVYWLSSEQVLAWCADLSMHIGNCKQAGWMKQAQVAAASSVEELEAIEL